MSSQGPSLPTASSPQHINREGIEDQNTVACNPTASTSTPPKVKITPPSVLSSGQLSQLDLSVGTPQIPKSEAASDFIDFDFDEEQKEADEYHVRHLSSATSLTSAESTTIPPFGHESQNRAWKDSIIGSYLAARTLDQEFHRELRLDMDCRANGARGGSIVAPVSPQGTALAAEQQPIIVKREGQRRYFLAREHMRPDDPFFGFEELTPPANQLNQFDKSPEKAPEELSARFSPGRSSASRSRTPTNDRGIGSLASADSGIITGNPAPASGLQLVANFSSVAPGQYSLYLNVKQTSEQEVTALFLVRILVRDTKTGTTEAYYTRFFRSSKDVCRDWHYLKSEDQFEIYPYEEAVQVNIHITQDDTYNIQQTGELLIRSLELIPVEMKPLSQVHESRDVDDNVKPRFTISTQALRDGGESNDGNHIEKGDLVSQHSTNHAPLTDGGDDENRNALKDKGVVKRLTTSQDGEFLAALTVASRHAFVQVWHKSDVERTAQSEPTPKELHQRGASQMLHFDDGDVRDLPLELAISANGKIIAVYQAPKMGEWSKDNSTLCKVGLHLFHNPLACASSQSRGDLMRIECPTSLMNTIGFATFVSDASVGATNLPPRFVFCDGRLLRVFEVNNMGLTASHAIPLANMPSALWLTAACELMMRSISTNMFIWVEDNGRYCSTWDLNTGTAIGRIDIAESRYSSSIGATSMQIASNNSIIAIVGFDNSITTVDASTGMLISRHLFSDRVIERIAFPSYHSPFLVAMFRGEHENQQTTLVLDPFRLNVHNESPFMPPLSRSTTFSHFGPSKWPEFGVICRPDKHLIHFHVCEAPISTIILPKTAAAELASDACEYELYINEVRPRRGATGRQLPSNWQVEIWRVDQDIQSPPNRKLVFQFIPEPWERETVKGQILPTLDRFVIHGWWTVQVWSLPEDDNAKCGLLYFWSAPYYGMSRGLFGKSDADVILDKYSRFSSTYLSSAVGNDGQALFQTTVVFPKEIRDPIEVSIPNHPMGLNDHKSVLESCVESTHLLALTYWEIQQSDLDGVSFEDHTLAIIGFVNSLINHSTQPANPNESGTSILKHLLVETCPKGISAKFIAALLEHDACPWVPHNDGDTDPLSLALELKNTIAVRAILAYCIRKAFTTHPIYVMSVERSFLSLYKSYPELLKDFFNKASYIPAQMDHFNKAHVMISTLERRIFARRLLSRLSLGIIKKPPLEKYRQPIITFQLREDAQQTDYELCMDKEPEAIKIRYDWGVFAVPFPNLITLGSGSLYRELAGKNYFDSPALLAVLKYKWWQYGLIYWLFRYLFLILFYALFMVMTVRQMQRSETIISLPGRVDLFFGTLWRGRLAFDVFLGLALLVFEMTQCYCETLGRYFATLFNYIDLAAITSVIICLCYTIHTHSEYGRPLGDVPPHFSFTSFAIVMMYLHLLVEFRVFRPVGIFVNIIVEIMKKIGAFFVIFTLMVIGFTHALVYLLYVYQLTCDDNGNCTRNEGASAYPFQILPSFASTFFFLGGRYDIVDPDFKSNRTSFLLLMIVFYFLCSIVMLTVLIAQVTESFNKASKDGERAWRRQLSETLAEAEMLGGFMLNASKRFPLLSKIAGFLRERSPMWRRRSQPFPSNIIYMDRIQRSETFKASVREKRPLDCQH